MFEFLVELKRASWALKDVFQLLKKCKMLSALVTLEKYETLRSTEVRVSRNEAIAGV